MKTVSVGIPTNKHAQFQSMMSECWHQLRLGTGGEHCSNKPLCLPRTRELEVTRINRVPVAPVVPTFRPSMYRCPSHLLWTKSWQASRLPYRDAQVIQA